MEQDVFMDIILKKIKEKFKSHLLRKERNIMHNVVYLIGRIIKDVEVSVKVNIKTYNNTNSRNNYSTGKTILPNKSTTSTLLPSPLSNNNINYRVLIKY